MSQSHDNVIVLRPAGGLLDLDLVAVWRYRELLYVLVLRDLQIRYKQAALGIAWAVLQPTLAVLIFAIVFGHFANLPSDGLPYPAFAFAAAHSRYHNLHHRLFQAPFGFSLPLLDRWLSGRGSRPPAVPPHA